MKSDFTIIPAIDIINGRCVRLTEGDYARQTVYDQDPLEMAQRFEGAGFTRLHLVDLDGAKTGVVRNWDTLEAITNKTKMAVDFGGGVQTHDEVSKIFQLGASYCTIGSLAVKNESLLLEWFEEFGGRKFLLGADTRNEIIVVRGWQETTAIGIIDFIEGYLEKGVQEIFCTDVAKDGKLEGPSIDLYKKIISRFPNLNLIASGGVSSIEDVQQLSDIGCSGVIIGKAIYENRISLKDLMVLN